MSSSERSLSSPEIDRTERAHFRFEAIELPTMFYSVAGKRTGLELTNM